jgi:hypothetical protein
MKKKNSKAKEDKMTGWLTGWKKIGLYIDYTPEMAKFYHKKFGLPITRSPGGKPMALPKKLDEWLEKRNFTHKTS